MNIPPVQEAYDKGLNIIESCTQLVHLDAVDKYMWLFHKHYVEPTYKNPTNFEKSDSMFRSRCGLIMSMKYDEKRRILFNN
jgi:hypothetical protein